MLEVYLPLNLAGIPVSGRRCVAEADFVEIWCRSGPILLDFAAEPAWVW